MGLVALMWTSAPTNELRCVVVVVVVVVAAGVVDGLAVLVALAVADFIVMYPCLFCSCLVLLLLFFVLLLFFLLL